MSDGLNVPPTAQANEFYAVFAGAVDQIAAQKIFQFCALGTQTLGIKRLHILFQSTGGFIAEGIALYNLFRAIPIELALYNAGGVYSIATIAYLGAPLRVVSKQAAFMIHRSSRSTLPSNADALRSIADALTMDDNRTEAILRGHLQMPEEFWHRHQREDVYLTADQAVAFGLATQIGDFSPAHGAKLWHLP